MSNYRQSFNRHAPSLACATNIVPSSTDVQQLLSLALFLQQATKYGAKTTELSVNYEIQSLQQ
jgi:hypothetical protein